MKQLIRHILREHTREIVLEMPKKGNQEDFLEKIKKIHGNKYDFSQVKYTKSDEKVDVICPIHGPFRIGARKLLQGQGCRDCGIERRTEKSKIGLEKFLLRAKQVHGDKYDYSQSEYVAANKPIKIICPKHGPIYPTPDNHISKKSGCFKCSVDRSIENLTKPQDEFIQQARDVHGDSYVYDDVDYKNTGTKVKIVCPKHGPFELTPNHHLRGVGCPVCQESKGERTISLFLEKNKIEFEPQKRFLDCNNRLKNHSCRPLPFDFYLPKYKTCIEYDGEQHFKPKKLYGGVEGLKKRQLYDSYKNEYCERNNINLIRVPYTLKSKDAIEKFILKELGIK
jgi:hypothetical protein